MVNRLSRRAIWLVWLLCFFCCPFGAAAQVSGVDVSVTPRSGSVDSSFEVLVIVDPRRIRTTPQLEDSDDFAVVGNSTRSQTFISNGEVTRQYAYAFSILPERAGTLEVPDITIVHNGTTRRIETGTIKVSEADSSARLLEDSDLVFRQSVDSLAVYQGEQVRNVFEILSDEPFQDVEFPAPAFPGFWVEAREQDRSGNKMQSGRLLYYFQTSRALYPLHSGVLELDPKQVTIKVRDRQRGQQSFRLDPFSFGSFFEQRAPRKVSIQSNPVAISVAPLPSPPSNASFWGYAPLVGHTSLSVQYESSPIDVSGSKSVHVVLETLGNANPLKELPLQTTTGYRVYQETPRITYATEAGKLRMRATFSASLVPTTPGQVEIPPLQLTYFDTEARQYTTLTSQPITFSVTGTLQPDSMRADQEPSSADGTGETPDPRLPEYRAKTFVDTVFETVSLGLVIFFAAILLLLGLICWLAVPLIRHRRYYRNLRARIDGAHSPDEISRAFEKHIQKMTGIRTGRLQKAELAQELSHYLTNKDLLFSVQNLLDSLDHARYKEDSAVSLPDLRSLALRIISAWH